MCPRRKTDASRNRVKCLSFSFSFFPLLVRVTLLSCCLLKYISDVEYLRYQLYFWTHHTRSIEYPGTFPSFLLLFSSCVRLDSSSHFSLSFRVVNLNCLCVIGTWCVGYSESSSVLLCGCFVFSLAILASEVTSSSFFPPHLLPPLLLLHWYFSCKSKQLHTLKRGRRCLRQCVH